VDGASNNKGKGLGVTLKGLDNISLKNQAEYEAFIAGENKLRCKRNFKLLTQQVNEVF